MIISELLPTSLDHQVSLYKTTNGSQITLKTTAMWFQATLLDILHIVNFWGGWSSMKGSKKEESFLSSSENAKK